MSTEPATGRPARRRGRPSRADLADGTPAARDRILASARAVFAERGYDKASIRAIARGAEVNPALVHHYFGKKEQVFAAAVADATAPAAQGLSRDTQFRPEEFGERFTRLFFTIWENPVTRSPLLAVVRSAVNNETAAGIFRGIVTSQMLARVAGGLDSPDAELRAELAAAQLIGAVLLRYVLKIEPLAGADAEDLIRRLSPVVQHHLTGTAGRPVLPPPLLSPSAPGPAPGTTETGTGTGTAV
ncbi:TetR family transcriptional regulator [Streptomyces sp. MP131-18]|uniref:TetR/AcrR family transcriptional regulator n=1 Tax=Streptomyces sp. MP131-18 TaxID=1857892 RepID=UPI00097C1858|nr:TetR family transcriptional regulator [Streptomyces sp. MP131-18]ONK12292.1 transcriptional regulator BetI [Streptomyces sp. MP131-18]